MPSDDDEEPIDDPPADESSDQNEFDPVNPSGRAALAAVEGHGYADDCIICVLEHVSERADESQPDRRLTVVRGLEATKQALFETSRLTAASTGTSMGLTLLCDDASARDTAVIDVVSILGVDRATVRQAHEASVDLGHWIEREIGLTFFVTKGKSGGPLFRCDGMPALFDDIDDIDQDAGCASSVGGDGYSSIFFSGHTSEVDLHGLIPLAVYSRTDPTARSTARRATDVEGSEGRRILSIGDFLDELLAR